MKSEKLNRQMGGTMQVSSLVSFYEGKQKKLGRQLTEKEKDFLKWLYEKHQEEILMGKSMSVYRHIKRKKKLLY